MNISVLDYFDELHPGPSWRPWRTFVKAVYGIPLDDDELSLFRQCTGRQATRPDGYPEAVAIVGVQCGKTETAATLTGYAALPIFVTETAFEASFVSFTAVTRSV